MCFCFARRTKSIQIRISGKGVPIVGYYTNYTLNVYPVSEDTRFLELIASEVEELGVGLEGNAQDGFSVNAKWYEYDEDMVKLSKHFPNQIFELYGDGEYGDDHWVAYYQNGESQHCQGRIEYDDCELAQKVMKLIT